MFWEWKEKTVQFRRRFRRLGKEQLEDRQMLAGDADELFGQVADLSNSSTVAMEMGCEANRTDVDRNGHTAPLDVLRLINEINKNVDIDFTNAVQRYWDVNADGELTAEDVLRVVNELNLDQPSFPSCRSIEVDVVMTQLGSVVVGGGEDVLVAELNVTSPKEITFLSSALWMPATTFSNGRLVVDGITVATNETSYFSVDFGVVPLRKGQTATVQFYAQTPERSGAYSVDLSMFIVNALPGATVNLDITGALKRTVNVVNWGLPQMLPEPSSTITQPTSIFLGQVKWVGLPGLLYHTEEVVLAFGGGNLTPDNAVAISVSGLHYRLPNGSVIDAKSYELRWDPIGVLYVTSSFDSWPAVNADEVWQIWADGITGLQPLVGVQMIPAVHPLGHDYWAHGPVRPIAINP